MSKKITVSIEQALELLGTECHKVARSKGFYSDLFDLRHVLDDYFVSASTVEQKTKYLLLYDWLSITAEQAAIGRMHSELSEWLEAIRHNNPPDSHLPKFSSAEIEAADVIICVLETCAFRDYRIGEAVRAKMEYNRSRPYKYGKNS